MHTGATYFMATQHVHLEGPPTDAALAHLRAHLHDDIALTVGTLPDNPHFEILIAGRPSRDLLTASPRLHTLIIPWAGLPVETGDLLREFPHIRVHNLHHNAPPTAEMALALLMAVARRLIPADRALRQNDWRPRYAPLPSVLLKGKTALILGYGAVGQHLGTILKAMGMRVMGTRRRHIDEAEHIYPSEVLHNLLPQADVLVVALPHTPDTVNLIDVRELNLLPKDAIVINIGRAAVINQYALYEALTEGTLFGAGLDVWYHYPPDDAARANTPPANVAFHLLDHVVMSPHRAGAGGNAEIEVLRMSALADLLNAAARGEPLPNQIDLKLGY